MALISAAHPSGTPDIGSRRPRGRRSHVVCVVHFVVHDENSFILVALDDIPFLIDDRAFPLARNSITGEKSRRRGRCRFTETRVICTLRRYSVLLTGRVNSSKFLVSNVRMPRFAGCPDRARS